MLASPLFWPLARWLEKLPAHPDTEAVAALAERAGLTTHSGKPLRFVPPLADGLGYEQRVWELGKVETRPENWHDFFNALVWLTFPRAKSELNARHWREMAPAAEGRGAPRDAMTHFDECGLVVLSSDPALLERVRRFQWKSLFWDCRPQLERSMRFVVFGHATYEQLLAPFRGLTAKAVLYEVPEDWLSLSPEAQLSDIDRRLAADFAVGLHARPRDLQPLPLLGVPGVTEKNEQAAYYDDTWQFRPGRRGLTVGSGVP